MKTKEEKKEIMLAKLRKAQQESEELHKKWADFEFLAGLDPSLMMKKVESNDNKILLNVIIFSKDRPMQLHLLLESILKNSKIDNCLINVLYKSSNDEYNRGYNTIRDLFPQFHYKREESFKEDLLSLFSDSNYTMFLTDDDIIYKSLKLTKDELHNIFEISDSNCFSLRLGLNTTNCYTMQRLNKLENYKTHSFIHDTDLIEPIISWKVSDGTNDYAYPMSVDGHIFKTDFIKNLCEVLEYTNPNLFEGFLSHFGKPEMIISSYQHSKLVNSPINRVQETFENLSGLKYKYSVEDLNEMYLDGVCFDFNKMKFNEITGCHQEIQPFFKVNAK
jgi:hypothetical protein